MSYTDAEMMMATQIAYLNSNGRNRNVGDMVDSVLSQYGTYDRNTGTYVMKEGVSGMQKAQFETAQNILNLSEQNNVTSWRNWTVVDSCNRENTSGFYGCLIDTGDGNAIVGCRGSESYDVYQGVMDWGAADVGRLNNPETFQQADATAYMQKLYEEYGDRYDKFGFTGHSLGGSLATHSAITAPEGMQDKIDRVVSYDGPGFSNEYLEKNREKIERIRDKIQHYEYSWVGSLLNQPDGIDNRVIQATDDKYEKGVLTPQLWRHATYNVIFDKDGNVIDGDRGVLQRLVGPMSIIFENSPIFLQLIYADQFVSSVLMAYIISVGEQVGKKMEELVKEIAEKANELYNSYLSLSVSGDYEIHPGEISHLTNDLNEVQKRMKRIAEEVDSIKRTLPYDSGSAVLFKARLGWTANALESQGEKAGKIAKTVDRGLVKYHNGDRLTAELF